MHPEKPQPVNLQSCRRDGGGNCVAWSPLRSHHSRHEQLFHVMGLNGCCPLRSSPCFPRQVVSSMVTAGRPSLLHTGAPAFIPQQEQGEENWKECRGGSRVHSGALFVAPVSPFSLEGSSFRALFTDHIPAKAMKQIPPHTAEIPIFLFCFVSPFSYPFTIWSPLFHHPGNADCSCCLVNLRSGQPHAHQITMAH